MLFTTDRCKATAQALHKGNSVPVQHESPTHSKAQHEAHSKTEFYCKLNQVSHGVGKITMLGNGKFAC